MVNSGNLYDLMEVDDDLSKTLVTNSLSDRALPGPASTADVLLIPSNRGGTYILSDVDAAVFKIVRL
jgi:hypothetical protein